MHIIHKWLNTLRTHTTNSLPPRWPRTQTTHGPTYSMVGELGASAWQQRSHLSMPFNYCGLTHSSCKATRYMDRLLQWLQSCIEYTAILCTQCYVIGTQCYVMRYTALFPNLAWSAFSVLTCRNGRLRKMERPGSIHHVNEVTWTAGGCRGGVASAVPMNP